MQSGEPNSSTESILGVLWSRRFLILSVVLVCVLAGNIIQSIWGKDDVFKAEMDINIDGNVTLGDSMQYKLIAFLNDQSLFERFLEETPEASFFYAELINAENSEIGNGFKDGFRNPFQPSVAEYKQGHPIKLRMAYSTSNRERLIAFERYVDYLERLLREHITSQFEIDFSEFIESSNISVEQQIQLKRAESSIQSGDFVYVSGPVYTVSEDISRVRFIFGSIIFGFCLGFLLSLVANPKKAD